jgi:hypothetical protein
MNTSFFKASSLIADNMESPSLAEMGASAIEMLYEFLERSMTVNAGFLITIGSNCQDYLVIPAPFNSASAASISGLRASL